MSSVTISDKEIRAVVLQELEKAEAVWNVVKPKLYSEGGRVYNFEKAIIQTQIPAHPVVRPGVPQVASFVALVLDIRNSSEHLRLRISERTAKTTNLERVLYETTAVFAACALIIDKYKGGVTEYLGDGFLSLFHIPKDKKDQEIKNAFRAAKKCLSATNEIVNDILEEKYGLPPLQVGIGMGYSQAVITTVGIGDNLHAKALGECVFWASKLSYGKNQIIISESLWLTWPTSEDGKLKFLLRTHPKDSDLSGYLISNS